METEISYITSQLLWKQSIIEVNIEKHKVLTSGNRSPIYVNCRKLISKPSAMNFIVSAFVLLLEDQNINYDYIAGGETAGIPFASWFACSTGKPMVYVRKAQAQASGRDLVEGNLIPKSQVLLVEDVITDGGSKIAFAQAIRDKGCIVDNCFVVLDRQQGGSETLENADIKVTALTDLQTALKVGIENKTISADVIDYINEYLDNPEAWHNKHNYPYYPKGS